MRGSGRVPPYPFKTEFSLFIVLEDSDFYSYLCDVISRKTDNNAIAPVLKVKKSGLFFKYGYNFGYKKASPNAWRGVSGGAGNTQNLYFRLLYRKPKRPFY